MKFQGKSTISGQVLLQTGQVDERTIEKYTREAEEKVIFFKKKIYFNFYSFSMIKIIQQLFIETCFMVFGLYYGY